MGFLSLKEELIKVGDIDLYLDQTGKATTNLFSEERAILVVEGSVPRDKAYVLPIFVEESKSLEKMVKEEYRVPKAAASTSLDYLNLLREKPGELFMKIDIEKPSIEAQMDVRNALKEMFEDKESKEKISSAKYHQLEGTMRDILKRSRLSKEVYIINNMLMGIGDERENTYYHSYEVGFLIYCIITDIQEKVFAEKNPDTKLFDEFKYSPHHPEVKFTQDYRIKYAVGGISHDLGKAFIDAEIINKRNGITSREYAEIKKHPKRGYDALKDIGVDDFYILDICKNHHPDYPVDNGPEPDKMPGPLAKLAQICDQYSALRMERNYKRSFTVRETIEILNRKQKVFRWNLPLYRATIEKILSLERMGEEYENRIETLH